MVANLGSNILLYMPMGPTVSYWFPPCGSHAPPFGKGGGGESRAEPHVWLTAGFRAKQRAAGIPGAGGGRSAGCTHSGNGAITRPVAGGGGRCGAVPCLSVWRPPQLPSLHDCLPFCLCMLVRVAVCQAFLAPSVRLAACQVIPAPSVLLPCARSPPSIGHSRQS
jgi:hypothetical protein